MAKIINTFLSYRNVISVFIVLAFLSGFSFMSCDPGNGKNNDFVALEMAESLANPENGMVAQINDAVNFLSNDAGSPVSRSTITISTENGKLSNFSWDTDNEYYIRTGNNLSVNIDDILWGTINIFTATCKFFNSTDTTGPGVQVNPDGTVPADIYSMTHTRDIDTSLTNVIRNIDKEIVIDADYSITGLNDGTDEVIVNGTRTAACESTGVNFTGNWMKKINLNNVSVIRQKTGDTTTYTYSGNAEICFEGAYIGTSGNTREVSSTATISFNGTKYVTVTIDGSTITINITTGEIS